MCDHPGLPCQEVAGTGHVSPLLVDGDRILRLVTEFWSAAFPKT
jgi:hypothetical protein